MSDQSQGNPIRGWERSLAIAAIAGVIAALPLLGGAVLFTRPLWTDEICCTLFPVEGASSPLEVIQRVARGQDYSPPLLHLMVWTTGRIVGGLSPVVIRSLSLLCVAVALYLVYVTLRRRFAALPSAAGATAVAGHSLLLAYAFEGRFYAPWLLFATAYAWSLGIDQAKERSPRRDTAQAIASVLLVTIHWFGVLSLGLMGLSAMLGRGPGWRSRLRFVAPGTAGLVALAACAPLYLAHRASATTLDVLWIAPLNAGQIEQMARLFFLSTVPVSAAALLVIDALRDTGPAPTTRADIRASLRDPSLAALFSLALFPLVLAVVSVVLQPSMRDRYAIVTLLAWGPLVALAVASLPRRGQIVALVVTAALGGMAASREIAAKRAFAETVRLNREAYARALEMRLPVVFTAIHTVWPVAAERRAERRALFIELTDSTIREMIPQPRFAWLRRHVVLERNIAQAHAQLYGFPVLVPQAQLDTTRAFLLVGPDESFPRLHERFDLFAGRVFPHHRGRRLSPNLALLER